MTSRVPLLPLAAAAVAAAAEAAAAEAAAAATASAATTAAVGVTSIHTALGGKLEPTVARKHISLQEQSHARAGTPRTPAHGIACSRMSTQVHVLPDLPLHSLLVQLTVMYVYHHIKGPLQGLRVELEIERPKLPVLSSERIPTRS